MGICNDCKTQGHAPPKEDVVPKIEFESIATCDSCNQKYWVRNGQKVERN